MSDIAGECSVAPNLSAVDGETVLLEAVDAYRGQLGERLLAAYALGSLAHGGFSELVSDVDLGLILSDPLEPGDPDAIQQIADAQRRKGSPLHERLSVFWGTPDTLAESSTATGSANVELTEMAATPVAANGVIIEHRTTRGWRFVTATMKSPRC